MSQLFRLVPRATANVLYISRMSAHNLPPGTPVKVPETKGGYHIVSGSGQFIATDGPSGPSSTGGLCLRRHCRLGMSGSPRRLFQTGSRSFRSGHPGERE